MQGRATTISSIVVVVVLAVVGVTSGWAVLSIRSAVSEMAAASSALGAYASLQRAVAAEAFAEAGYHRAPSEAARARIDESIAAVTIAVAAVSETGGRTDDSVATYITLANARYTTELLTDLDDPQPAGDDRVAGPALDSIQMLLDGAVQGHRADVAAATTRQLALTRTLVVVFPVVIGASLVGLALSWRMVALDQRLLRVTAADSHHQSLHDPLTGLANRRLFNQSLAAALARPQTDVALLFLDLDGFKAINDGLGHDAGDRVLAAVALRLRASVRGDLVSRLGGDEFAVLLQPSGTPERVARRILRALEEPMLVDGTEVTVGTSIGIAVSPADGLVARDLLRRADAALYLAKAAGKGTWARPGTAVLVAPPVAGAPTTPGVTAIVAAPTLTTVPTLATVPMLTVTPDLLDHTETRVDEAPTQRRRIASR